MLNMGKVVDSNIVIEIKRTYPNGITQVIQRDTIPGIRYADSVSLKIPIITNRDVGLNRITITVDADNSVDELYETNNTITKDVFIYNDAAKPIYPYNFSIVNKQNIKLVASTANRLLRPQNMMWKLIQQNFSIHHLRYQALSQQRVVSLNLLRGWRLRTALFTTGE
jgi:hypothetical protein